MCRARLLPAWTPRAFSAAAACLLALLVTSARADEAVLAGYVTPLSVAPGDTLSLMISSSTEYQLTFARYKRVTDQNESIPVTAPRTLPAGVQAAPDSAWEVCGWAVSDRFVIPADWPSGIYGAECSAPDVPTHRISFVVRPRPDAHGDFAMLANTNTWNAYNKWGGQSKYTYPAAHYLSFLRPNPAADPAEGEELNHLARAELWVQDWLAASGYHFDVYSDWDFHQGIPDLDAYKALILNTHPEYWSREMLDRLETYLAHGGCLLYMGGNGIYEEVVFSADGNVLTMFPEYFCGENSCRRPSYFRNLTPPRPERAILGVAYRSDAFMTFGPFRVLQAGHRFFAGTGVADGDSVGWGGYNGGASGWEMDTSIPGTAADGVIVTAFYDNDRGSPPANIELLARGANEGGYGADMTYYATPAGGGVFAAGSLSFGGCLVGDPVLQRVVRNVLDEFLQRPLAGVAAPDAAPGAPALRPNVPNPFASSTRIPLALAREEHVRLRVFDIAGRLVRTLVDGAGPSMREGSVTWDGLDDEGHAVANGVYQVRLEAGDHAEGRRVLRLR